MSGIHRKGQLGASGTLSAGGDDTVDSIFNTRLFSGSPTDDSLTLTTGVNTSGGGSIWIKDVGNAIGYGIYDQVRGASKLLQPAVDSVEETHSGVTTFGNGNFTVGGYDNFNASGRNYVVNTFKNTEGFFDTVTWTGDGTTDRSISHNLGAVPGMIIAKQIGTAGDWHVLHKYHTMSGTGNSSTGGLKFNTDGDDYNTHQWEFAYPTSSIFKVSHVASDSGQTLNANSATYIAYLFGHDAVGTAGGKIQTGSYTGNGSAGLNGPAVVIGWEPQWLLIKKVTSVDSWLVYEQSRHMSGFTNESTVNTQSTSKYFEVDTGSAEVSTDTVHFQPDGFRVTGTAAEVNTNLGKYIWMAIRKGIGNTPTSSSSVFHIDHAEGTSPSPPRFSASFNPDMVIRRSQIDAADAWQMTTRHMQGNLIRIDTDSIVDTGNSASTLAFHNGWCSTHAGSADTEDMSWMWKKQKGFFDTGIYKGLGSNRTQVHNLGAVPEMMWVKRLDATNDWNVYHKSMNGGSSPEDYYMKLNHNGTETDDSAAWFDTAPTASVFTVGGNNDFSLGTYTYCLFASVAGVSSIGSFSHTNGSATNVNCGFSSGAKFILARKRDGGNWYVWDSKRGGENVMYLNLNSGQTNTYDTFDTLNSGFTVTDTNTGGLDTGNWIYYAIAA
jgi:hypothetical protein